MLVIEPGVQVSFQCGFFFSPLGFLGIATDQGVLRPLLAAGVPGAQHGDPRGEGHHSVPAQ